MGEKAQSSVAEIVAQIDQIALKLEGTMNEIIEDIQLHSSPISPVLRMPLNQDAYDTNHNRHIQLRNLAHAQRNELRSKIMNLYIALQMQEDVDAMRRQIAQEHYRGYKEKV